MSRIIGGGCNKPEAELVINKDTFFLAEPFAPEKERQRRERVLRDALREELKDAFYESNMRVADKEPKDPALFCDICRMI